jgi:anti-sigma factor ChrR (cupin superfamily)
VSEPSQRRVLPDVAALAASPDALPWRPMRPGVEICRLYGEGPAGPGAALLRYAPGGAIPSHTHVGHEQIFILNGSQTDERGSYGPGTLIVNPPGSSHAVTSPDGCVVLVTWERGTSLI